METAAVRSPFGDEVVETIEHLNEDHDDTVTFIARVLGGLDGVRAAQVQTVDHVGVGFDVVLVDGGRRSLRIAFPDRADSADAAYQQFWALLGEARRRSNETQLTSIEKEMTTGTIPTWITTVSAITDITPRMRQISMSGGLDGYQALAPDQFVYVLAPPHGTKRLTIDADFSWGQYEAMPEVERPVGAYYTVRRFDRATATLDLWVVLHGHGGDGERWARNAEVGDPVALWGPRQAYEPPADSTSVVLLGDETALPAIAAILESLPAGHHARVIVALHEPAHAVALRSAAEIDLTWIDDLGDNPLLDAVRAIGLEIGPDTYVWGAGESRQISAVRRFARDTLGSSRSQVSLTGYWRAARV